MQMLKHHYDSDLEKFVAENTSLRSQIAALERSNYVETEQLREKYSLMSAEDINLARQSYLDDLRKLL